MWLVVIGMVVGCLLYRVYECWWQCKEDRLLTSREYAEALLDWKKIQAWFVKDFEGHIRPFPLLLDTGEFAPLEIIVSVENGELKIPKDLRPSQFIIAVRQLKRFFDVE